MNQTRNLWFVAAATVALVLFSGSAFGGDIKSRMKDRLPQIIALKEAGVIGEDNQGFLAFVGTETKAKGLVEAENKDRQLVYDAIAKQQGTTAQLVGQRRAMQIADKAKPGEWVQDADGKWRQK